MTLPRLTAVLVLTALASAAMVLAVPPLTAGAATIPSAGDWSMYRDGPAHNAVNRAETALSPTTVGGLHITHTFSHWNPWLNPIVAGRFLYGLANRPGGGYIRAHHLPSGTLAWQQPISGKPDRFDAPAVSHGVVFVGGSGAMYAFDAVTGHPLWTTTTGSGGNLLEATVSGSTVYAATAQAVYAFDGGTGRILWSAIPPGCCLTGPVSVAGGLAYVVTDQLVAYNAATGAPVFTSPSNPSDTVEVSNGTAYVASAFVLEAFNARSGARLWSSQTEDPNGVGFSPYVAVDGGTVVVGTSLHLIAFDASTGTRLWTLTGDFTVQAIANGVVYSAAAKTSGLDAVDEATGSILYSGGFDCVSAIVSHGAVYVPCLYGMAVFSL